MHCNLTFSLSNSMSYFKSVFVHWVQWNQLGRFVTVHTTSIHPFITLPEWKRANLKEVNLFLSHTHVRAYRICININTLYKRFKVCSLCVFIIQRYRSWEHDCNYVWVCVEPKTCARLSNTRKWTNEKIHVALLLALVYVYKSEQFAIPFHHRTEIGIHVHLHIYIHSLIYTHTHASHPCTLSLVHWCLQQNCNPYTHLLWMS